MSSSCSISKRVLGPRDIGELALVRWPSRREDQQEDARVDQPAATRLSHWDSRGGARTPHPVAWPLWFASGGCQARLWPQDNRSGEKCLVTVHPAKTGLTPVSRTPDAHSKGQQAGPKVATCALAGLACDSASREQRKLMQGNYVKLLHPQARDLGKRDGRSSNSGTTSHRISHHVRSPGLRLTWLAAIRDRGGMARKTASTIAHRGCRRGPRCMGTTARD